MKYFIIGQKISHYNILEKLGEGGMGVVYKAQDTKLNRFVALKFLPQKFTDDFEAKERFIREAQAASALDHLNICTIYEIDETDYGQMFICMAYYDAETLKQKIEHGPLPVEQTIDIIRQICRGLAKAHQQGLIHRDIKPGNILITNDGIVKIIDFGLALLEGQIRLTKDKTSMGTVAYISPEQASGEDVDCKTDIWAVGVMLYEMLTGQLPFKGDIDQVVIYSILHENPIAPTTLCPEIPKEMELIIERALQKETESRYQNIDEMEKDLKKVRDKSDRIDSFDTSKKRASLFFNKKIKKISIAVVILFGLFLIFLIFKPYILKKPTVNEPLPIAVISFQNQTGNDAYNYLQQAIPNLLITSLEQSPYLRVTTWERMYDLLKQIGKRDIKVIDKDIGFELCRLDGVDMVVTGSYVKADNVFMTDVKVLDVSTKEIIKSVSSQGDGVASILLNQIDDLSKEISKGVGLSVQTIKSSRVQLAEVTTFSIDAYRNFLQGREKFEKSYWEDAIIALKKAVDLDSTFAMAYLYLGIAYEQIYDNTGTGWALNLAKKYSHKTTEKERLYIEETSLRWTPEKRLNILNEMAIKYPKEKRVHYKLGEIYLYKKMLDEAIQAYQRSLALDPTYGYALKQLAHTYVNTGNYDRALEILNKYNALFPEDAEPLISMGDLYYYMGKLDEAIIEYEGAIKIKPDFYIAYMKIAYCYALMEDYNHAVKWINQYTRHVQSEGAKGEALWWTAYYQYWLGQFKQSISTMNSFMSLAQQMNHDFGKAIGELLLGSIYYECQDYETSRTIFNNAFKVYLSTGFQPNISNYNYIMALIDLEEEQVDSVKSRLERIQNLLTEINEKDPWSIELVKKQVRILQAEVLLADNRIDRAISTAEKNVPAQIYLIPSVDLVLDNMPFRQDILARAFLEAGHPEKAITVYERLIRFCPDSKDRRLIYPKYHYHLAKLYQQTDQTEKAIAQYQKLLEIWKNADQDRPELIYTKNRLEKLTGKKIL